MVRILKRQDIKTTSKKANKEQSVKHNTWNKVKNWLRIGSNGGTW